MREKMDYIGLSVPGVLLLHVGSAAFRALGSADSGRHRA